MQQLCEYCELWWGDGNRPRLTFYNPLDNEGVFVEKDSSKDNIDSWDALQGAITELGLSGWELLSAPQHGGGLFFRRKLH